MTVVVCSIKLIIFDFFFQILAAILEAKIMASRKSTNDSASSSRSNRNTSKDDNGADPNTSDDKLFEPSLEMMVNDFDDESTLELEEKMASTEAQDPNAELNSLQKVSYNILCLNAVSSHDEIFCLSSCN